MDKISSKQVIDVSVLSANYNNGPYIHDYFQSILNSNVLPREIIFVDDGSTDQSLEELINYDHLDFLKIIRLPKNIGFAHALNLGIEESLAEYIIRIDPDDFMAKERIERQYNYLINHQQIDLIGSNVFYFHGQDQRIILKSNMPRSHKGIQKAYIKGNHGLFHTSVAGKAQIFKQLKYRQSFYPAEDYDFFSRAVNAGFRMSNQTEALTYYRIHNNNLSFLRLKNSIYKTVQARKEIFQLNTSPFRGKVLFYQRFYYRKSLMAGNIIVGLWYTLLTIILRPQAIFRRMI